VPYPVCCPSRATILTGLYPHNHRVLSNYDPYGGFTVFKDANTLGTWLTRDYATALVGKYLNDYADTKADRKYVPPGWDAWKASVDPWTYNYMGQTLNLNGRLRSFPGVYSTTLFGQQGRVFLDQQGSEQPFFLYEGFVAPHGGRPFDPGDDKSYGPFVEPKYRDTYTGPTVPTANGVPDSSYDEADVSDKESGAEDKPALSDGEVANIAETLAQRRESLRSVDDQIAATMNKVRKMGQLDNTYFVFVSDNGVMQGQHRISNHKVYPYEPSGRIPLIIRGPGIPAGGRYNGLTGMQDLAPTILDMTNEFGSKTGPAFDGRTLLPLLSGATHTDRPILFEVINSEVLSDQKVARLTDEQSYIEQNVAGTTADDGDWQIRGIITQDRWKYVRYPKRGGVEMYDLAADPYELQNLAGNPAYADKQAALGAEQRACQDCAARQCW
jgi:arylsulfatase A-like enzyme